MKKGLFIISIVAFLFSGCEETKPGIDFYEPVIPLKDSTSVAITVPVPQHKAVLIEDVTGVRCNNCPEAAKKAKDIIAQKTEDSVVVIALYPIDVQDNNTRPYPGVPQLANDIAKQIVLALGSVPGLPRGYVDRKLFVGTDRSLSYQEWINYTNIRLKEKTPVNIFLNKTISARSLKVEVKLQYNSNTISGGNPHKYALYITEDGIISTQDVQSGNGKDLNYIHNHAMRYAFGQPLGNPLKETMVPGRTYIKQFEYEMPKEYVIDNCHVVCVVLDSVTEEVINVREIPLK